VEAIHLYFATLGTGVKQVMSLQNYIADAKNIRTARFVLPKLDALVPVSRSMQEWYVEAGFRLSEKFHVIYNAVDPDRLISTRLPGTASLRDELGIDGSGPLLGMIGNFRPDNPKDQWTICEALPTVLAQFPTVHFIFVGKVYPEADEYYRRCVNYCRENDLAGRVHFLGARSDIPDLLHELDLFVFSSVHEGLPLAAIEALLLGVPMLVSDIPPLLEVIGADTPEGPCAEIFRTGDAKDLAAKLSDLLGDETRLAMLGSKARVQTPKRFGIAAHMQNLLDLYERLLQTD
jgi:glycosyltransferase involved in cell wall biosynthesis